MKLRQLSADERVLLHPGAIGLAAYVGMHSNELGKLFREGEW